jgi:alpha-tubulin suppressor-like RCC1 family protein
VSGGLSFSGVAPGNGFTCGVTTAKKVYCWGYNGNGQLGIGTASGGAGPLTPAPTLGGHLFSWVSAGQAWTCGVSGGQGYCWGFNGLDGHLGDGTTMDRYVPTAVAEP